VRLGPPQHRGGVPTALLVVGMELRSGALLGGQPGDSCVGVGDDYGGIRFGGRHSPAVRGGFLMRNRQMQERVDDPLPQSEFVGLAWACSGVCPQRLDAVGDLLDGRRRGGRTDEPAGERV
jgi:hypothetical protein